MLGGMQDWPLLVWKLIDHAATNHGSREVVSLTCEGTEHRSNWAEVRERSLQVASGLSKLGIGRGDRVATLAWNTHCHVECWYGISGMGAVAHTVNPRLFEEQIVYILNHAGDRALFFDLTFVPLVEKIAPQLKTVEHFILMTDAAHMPADSSLDLTCYETFVAEAPAGYSWAEVEETAPAGLCYTSGTTGNPKGVLYTHRSNVLHTFGGISKDALSLGSSDVALPVVPMYHANAWGMPYATAAVGAKLVMGGPHFDPETLHKLMLKEGVTMTAAVPTIWLGMLQYLEKTGQDLGALERVVIGGSACPRSMIVAFKKKYGVDVFHAWGMTEMSPLGTVGTLSASAAALNEEAQFDIKTKQGRAIFGVEMKIVDEDGNDLPRDGKAFGHLLVRGPWVAEEYFGGDGGVIVDEDCWFDTGDVATIDSEGYMQITDRSKDVIKSGGEWISSIELENEAVGAEGVAEAAVIGLPHPKWDERPLLVVVPREGASPTKEAILSHLEGRIAKWWMPDDIVFVDEIPHTATGKIQKTALREQFKDYELPTAKAA
ncbi:long-chain fatty acid--CoA ligase [Pacificimonas flava]|uniref:3-methylmercaptopropionyl-CoA ligase n=3 Tax=Sphingosinicellaceae TaxID=2820280 RepID=A0A219B8T3_9SPHN|nr:long-chain-fatty-acid--CoA ligase [Pacificimonas flava]MBZ6379912.1 long-chain-fatty-acid--CoA ligase [Pacificimonas aurantium]OWV34800.1 long-chain fatty acid--CoA ligase [Pacificimonas flava]